VNTVFSDLSEAGNTLPLFSKVFKGSINAHSDSLTQFNKDLSMTSQEHIAQLKTTPSKQVKSLKIWQNPKRLWLRYQQFQRNSVDKNVVTSC
jgi:hypothetical protein